MLNCYTNCESFAEIIGVVINITLSKNYIFALKLHLQFNYNGFTSSDGGVAKFKNKIEKLSPTYPLSSGYRNHSNSILF